MNEAIKLAIEAGYKASFTYLDYIFGKMGNIDMNNRELFGVFLDPLFWQALGKALNWNMGDSNKATWNTMTEHYAKYMIVFENTPIYHWHRFIDWVAEGKNMDEFFKELMKSKNLV